MRSSCLPLSGAAASRAVYRRFILLGLMIPAEKFRSKREIVPDEGRIYRDLRSDDAILHPAGSDRAARYRGIRGASTSEKGQMAYILGQPLAYAWVLICNLFRTLPSYVLGENSLGLLGFLPETLSFHVKLYARFGGRLSSAGRNRLVENVCQKNRSWIFILCGNGGVLVWTSMYIAFTRPGNTYIDGVQGR